MSLIINGSEMQEEYKKVNAGTTVSVDEFYRVLYLYAELKISQEIETCLLSSKTNSPYMMDQE